MMEAEAVTDVKSESEKDAEMARLMFEKDEAHDRAAYQSRLLDDDGEEIEDDGEDEQAECMECQADYERRIAELNDKILCLRAELLRREQAALPDEWKIALPCFAVILGCPYGVLFAPIVGAAYAYHVAYETCGLRWIWSALLAVAGGALALGLAFGIVLVGKRVSATFDPALLCRTIVGAALWLAVGFAVVRVSRSR